MSPLWVIFCFQINVSSELGVQFHLQILKSLFISLRKFLELWHLSFRFLLRLFKHLAGFLRAYADEHFTDLVCELGSRKNVKTSSYRCYYPLPWNKQEVPGGPRTLTCVHAIRILKIIWWHHHVIVNIFKVFNTIIHMY